MTAVHALAAFPKPSQVVLGTVDVDHPQPEGSKQPRIHQQPYRDNIGYLAGRELRDGITVQTSFDQVCILSRSQRFEQALPFWDAFSGSQDTDACISCTAVGLSEDHDEILLAAAMDHRIAVWNAPASSPTSSRKWKVHSTLTNNDGVITTLDIAKGQLLVGTTTGLAIWRLDSSDIPIWRRSWAKSAPAAISIAKFSPDATNIAAVAQGGQNVLLWQYQPRASRPPSLQQSLYHARPITGLLWRHPPEQNSQADVLISYASDGVARIWAPVIDEPTQLRLWCNVDRPSFSSASSSPVGSDVPSTYYLDPYILCTALRTNIGILQREIQMAELGVGSSTDLSAQTLELELDLKRTRLRRLEQLANETPDIFLSFDSEGFVSLTAVANIDRRPPTLLQVLTVLRVPFQLPNGVGGVRAAAVLPLHVAPDSSSIMSMLTLHVQFQDGSSQAYAINPATFFDGRGFGIEADNCHPCGPEASPIASQGLTRRHTSRIRYLQKSGDGRVLLSASAKETIAWSSDASSERHSLQLHYKGTFPTALQMALFWDGSLTAHLMSEGVGELRRASDDTRARFECDSNVQHLALASFDGAHLLVAVTRAGRVYGWPVEKQGALRLGTRQSTQLWHDTPVDRHLISAHSTSASSAQLGHNFTLVTADSSGVIEVRRVTGDPIKKLCWDLRASFRDHSGSPRSVCCSVSGLVAAVYHGHQEQQTLVIYNSQTTSFNSGEEYRQSFEAEQKIITLDWSPSPLSSNALSVVFEHHIDVIAPGRFSTFDKMEGKAGPRWEHLVRLDLRSCTPSPIRSACWLASEQLAVASSSILFVYGPWIQTGSRDMPITDKMHLSELIAEVGGPVVQYHPAYLLQCAIWCKLGLAKSIIGNLEKAASACSAGDVAETWAYEEVGLDMVLQDDSAAETVASGLPSKPVSRGNVFDDLAPSELPKDEDLFASERIDTFVRHLEELQPPHLSNSDTRVLVNLIRAIGEAVREHRSLDASGLRYMLSLRQMLNNGAQSRKDGATANEGLSYRDHLWAFHSENQETLLAAIDSAFGNKLNWPAARSTGVFVWVRNLQALRSQAEAVARAQFMSAEDRDPVKCSLLYFALGKRKVVQGLWRQAVWHPEQKKMLQFLSHDFDEERWRIAAQKNAFALLSQRRYEFAASFFMLGESLRDAVNVCVRNLDDLSLAIALARIKEGGDDGPVFADLLKTRVLPLAFERGDRWMGSWAFWMLKRRDLAVRIIVVSFLLPVWVIIWDSCS